MSKKIKLEQRLERYEDFYNRAFSTVDVDKILKEGGGANLEEFKQQSRGATTQEYHDVMFNRILKTGKTSDKLGKNIFARFFEMENITKNKANRLIVRTGTTLTFKGKTFKGGQFIPTLALAKRVM